MERKRVVITGLGTVNPLGNNLKETWDAALNGKSGIDLITKFDTTNFETKIAGEVKNLDYSDVLSKKEAKRMDLFTIFGMYAAAEAVNDAGIDFSLLDNPFDAGVIIGVGMGGIQTFEDQLEVLKTKGPRRVSPFFVPMLIPDILPGHIAIKYGIKGDNYTTTSACASSGHAIVNAYWSIATGKQKVIITGGAEAAITQLALAGFNSSKALSTRNDAPHEASRPFDKDRDGFIMAEGAAILILEELEFAKKRGAKIYAEIAGFGISGDAYHITAPDPEGKGAVAAMEKAIKMAGIPKEEVTHINAHGTSTPFNDKFETLAIKKVFGEHAYKIKVCSTKSMTGHLLGAAGAIEALFTTLALKEQVIPPTTNYTTPDPECDLDYNPNKTSEFNFKYALSNSFGFGGHNASILFKKFED